MGVYKSVHINACTRFNTPIIVHCMIERLPHLLFLSASPGVLLDFGGDGEGEGEGEEEEKGEEPVLIEEVAPPKKTKAKASKSKATEVCMCVCNCATMTTTHCACLQEKSLDDMEFWLSGNDVTVAKEVGHKPKENIYVIMCTCCPCELHIVSSYPKYSCIFFSQAEPEPEEVEAEESPKVAAKSKKTKKTKSEKKTKKSKKREAVEEDTVTGGGNELLGLDTVSSVPETPKSSFRLLAEDENLAMV